MRIVWRDSREYKDVKYRGQIVSYLYGKGWVTGLPGDHNVYYDIESAENAIDKMLGGKTRKDASARHAKGIRIIGQLEAIQ